MRIFSRLYFPLRRSPFDFFVYALIIYSMYCVFDLKYGIDSYRPWRIRAALAAEAALLAHFGLWLAMIPTKSRLRFITLLILTPTMAGLSLLWWLAHPSIAVFSFGIMSWLFFRVLLGK